MSSLHSKSSTKPSSIPLYRRLLFPDLPPTSLVPPILPHASTELNTELYDLIALALRAYITPWWSKITRYDNEFVPHVASIIDAVVRGLATRLEMADVTGLVFRAVPVVVAQHYADYRAAAAKVGSAYASGGAATLAQLFHQHQSHMGIDADGAIDPTYIRHLVDLILQACLPLEDQESDAERAIIREVLVKVILKDSIPLLCQPWFIHKLMLDQLRSGREASIVSAKETEAPQTRNPSLHSMIVFVLSTVQYLSGLLLTLIHWYKQAVIIVRHVNLAPQSTKAKQEREFALSLLRCSTEILDARSRVAATAVFEVLESVVKLGEEFADRVLGYLLWTYVMTEAQVVTIVRVCKRTLFPNGYPGPPLVVPSSEEQAEIKEQLMGEIELRVPRIISNLILGPRRETIEEALEPLSSPACNAHLILFLLDLIVLALFPEFAVEVTAEEGRSKDGSSNVTVVSSASPSPSPEPEAAESRSFLS